MDQESEVTFEFVSVIRQFKSGRVERLLPANPAPPSVDAATGVASKDVTIDATTGLWARLYLPPTKHRYSKSQRIGVPLPPATNSSSADADDKLAIVVYLHGGGFVAGSAADAPEHAFLNRLCARARVLAVSVEYRLAPEHPVPACYDDAWTALRWAAAEAGTTADPWIRGRGDRARLFVVGKDQGLSEDQLEELWAFACAARTTGPDDPRVNPVADGAPSLRRLGCDRVLVCVAEDELGPRGKAYHDGLLASGWAEEDAQLLESAGEDHEFFLRDPGSAKALLLMHRLMVAFLGAKNQ
ncbi:unnamed protein product [Alopecurus aequalis]